MPISKLRILEMYKDKRYLALTAALAAFMFFFYPWVQTLGLQTDLWYTIITPERLALFLAFDIVFGAFISFQVMQLRGPKICTIKQAGKRSVSGVLGAAFGFFVGVCPACLGFTSLLLPLAAVTVLVVFGPAFMLLSIALMAVSIYLNGGFKAVPGK